MPTPITLTRYPTQHIVFNNNSGVSGYNFSPIADTLGRPDYRSATSSAAVYTKSIARNNGFNFNIPLDATINSVKVRFYAPGNSLATDVSLGSSGPGLETYETVSNLSPNTQRTLTRAFTPAELNDVHFAFFTQSDAYTKASLDAMEIEVSYTDPRDLVLESTEVYAVENLAADTTIQGASGGSTYLSEGKFLGKPDNIYASLPSSTGTLYRVSVKMGQIVLPEDAIPYKTHFAIFTTVPGTVQWANANEFTNSTIYAAGSVTNSPMEFVTNITPSREELVNKDNYMRYVMSAASRKSIDGFRLRIEYYVPPPSGPVTKYYSDGTWVTASSVRKFDGTSWVNTSVTKY